MAPPTVAIRPHPSRRTGVRRPPGRAAGARGPIRRRRIAVDGVVVLVLVVGLGASLAGCADDGRTLNEPGPEQTTTTSAPTTTAAGSPLAGDTGAADSAAMTLSSATLAEGEAVPAAHTCEGADVSPSLAWSGVPAGTVELAVVVRDLDADGFVHWVVAGLAPDVGGLAEGHVPEGAVEASNDFGRAGWGGPCPPEGTHHYELRVYALAQPSGVTSGQEGADAAAAVENGSHLASAALSVVASAG